MREIAYAGLPCGLDIGEAHYIAVSPRGELYVSDTVNRAVQKFVPRTD